MRIIKTDKAIMTVTLLARKDVTLIKFIIDDKVYEVALPMGVCKKQFTDAKFMSTILGFLTRD